MNKLLSPNRSVTHGRLRRFRRVVIGTLAVFTLYSLTPLVSAQPNAPAAAPENRTVTGFSFKGNTLIKADELQKVLVSQTGEPLSVQNVGADVGAIRKAYKDKGYAVLVQGASQNNEGVISFGLLEAKLTKIEIEGLTKTDPAVVRKVITSPVNEPWNADKLRQDLKALSNMHLFKDVSYDLDDDPQVKGGIIVTFTLQEAAA